MRSAGTSGLAAIIPRVTPHMSMEVKEKESISGRAMRKKTISVAWPASRLTNHRARLRSIQTIVKRKAEYIEKGLIAATVTKCDVTDMSHP